MKRIAFSIILLFLLGETGFQLFAQKILVVERPGTVKNFKYEPSDWIKIKILPSGKILAGKISGMTDSSFTINKTTMVKLSEIGIVFKRRWGFLFLQQVFILAGIPYLGISLINGAINDDKPIISTGTIIIGSSIIAAGAAITPLVSRKLKVDNENWRIRILNFDQMPLLAPE